MVNYGSIGQSHHHLHREVVAVQMQTSFFTQRKGRFLSLQILQFFDQGPAADEALVEESEDGRTFQDCLPESPP